MSIGGMAEAFAFMMTQTISLAPFAGRNQFGDETWGAAKTYPARVSVSSEALYSAGGEVIVSKATIFFFPRATDGSALTSLGVEPDNAKITLPDGTTPRILQIGVVNDEAGGIIYWRALV